VGMIEDAMGALSAVSRELARPLKRLVRVYFSLAKPPGSRRILLFWQAVDRALRGLRVKPIGKCEAGGRSAIPSGSEGVCDRFPGVSLVPRSTPGYKSGIPPGWQNYFVLRNSVSRRSLLIFIYSFDVLQLNGIVWV